MHLRQITRRHMPSWLTLREKLYPSLDQAFHLKEMDLILDSPDAASFLCMADEEEIAGLLELSLRNFVDGCLGGPVGYIEGLFLSPEYRGKGHGGRIVDLAGQWFRGRGCTEMATDVELPNEGAQRFFSAVGFRETFRIVEFKRSLEPTSH